MVRASVRLDLEPAARGFRLPATGTPSLLYRFVDEHGDEVLLGARAFSDQVEAFAPGTACDATWSFGLMSRPGSSSCRVPSLRSITRGELAAAVSSLSNKRRPVRADLASNARSASRLSEQSARP